MKHKKLFELYAVKPLILLINCVFCVSERKKVRFQKPESTLPCKISKEKEAQLEKYKHILLVIAQVVHMLGKQGLPFRGHTDNFKDIQNEKNNAGNFIEILKLMSIGDPILKEYLRAPTSRKTTFLSW